MTNLAEQQQQILNNPTMKQCYNVGLAHKAYGWSGSPPGHWNEHQKEMYMLGYTGQDQPIT